MSRSEAERILGEHIRATLSLHAKHSEDATLREVAAENLGRFDRHEPLHLPLSPESGDNDNAPEIR